MKGLPEKLLEDDRSLIYTNFRMNYPLKDSSSIDQHSWAVYNTAHRNVGAIRAGNAWYKASPQDVVDDRS